MAKYDNHTLEEVIALCLTYMNSEHVTFVKKAFDVANKAHKGQMRKSGETYISHPVQVAYILAGLNMDPVTVATGFLHDVVEDTDYTYDDLAQIFSQEVADLVDGVTKLGKFEFNSKEEHQAENHRKMLLAMANDVRVVLVKLADRLHNMRTLKFHKPEKQQAIARETLEIYAPLADRLGINRIKWELEDIALRYINPQQYYRIVHLMKSRREDRENYIANAKDMIQESVDELDIEAEITGRPKHIYSIYAKMKNQHKQFNEIYDLLALRVIVESVKDCYAVLGAIHTRWKPLPGRFKDYIAMPKTNMYQSLHTTVLGPKAFPLEVQIRTPQMHQVAEYGVAAHWAYKEGIIKKADNQEISWFRDIIELQSQSSNAHDFMDSIKEDIFKDMVYVFSPKGDVIELPRGSSTLDFAYHIHTEIGNNSTGAKVNGKIVPLNYKLKNGDIVEMLTSSNSFGPSRDWLKFVSTSKARNRIKHFFKTQQREENIELGKEMLTNQLEKLEFNPKDFMNKDRIQQVADRTNYKSANDLFAAIGFGEIRVSTVAHRMTEKERKQRDEERKKEEILTTESTTIENKSEKMKVRHEDGVVVQGSSSMLLRISKCCNPVPGDPIVGYITRGRGVSIHRADCPNIQEAKELEERLIDVEWEGSSPNKIYDAELQIHGYDRNGLLNEILQVINIQNNSLKNVNAKIIDQDVVMIKLKIGTQDLRELKDIVSKIKKIPDVYSVKRLIS